MHINFFLEESETIMMKETKDPVLKFLANLSILGGLI